MSIFTDNIEANTIQLEDKIFIDKSQYIGYLENGYLTSSAVSLSNEFELSKIRTNIYPPIPQMRIIEPKSNPIRRRSDYKIGHSYITCTWKKARKTVRMFDLLKPEYHDAFFLCGNIPEGLLRIGIMNLQILPESIPNGEPRLNDICDSLWRDFYRSLFNQIEQKVESAVSDRYKIKFSINERNKNDFYFNKYHCCVYCSFELLSIDNEPVSWWGWDTGHFHEDSLFNLRAHPVKLEYGMYLYAPDFAELKKKYQ